MNRLCIALLLAVATAAVASNGEPEVPAVFGGAELGDYELDKIYGSIENVPESRQNLILGENGPNDRLLARISHIVRSSAFMSHDQDVTYRGPKYTNITGIFVTRIGNSQFAVPMIRSGGLWNDYVKIRFVGARDFGYEYNIDIYASINCSNS